MTKLGRPVVGKPLIIDVKVRIDEDTNKKLLEYSKKYNLTKAEAIRKSIDMLLKEEK